MENGRKQPLKNIVIAGLLATLPGCNSELFAEIGGERHVRESCMAMVDGVIRPDEMQLGYSALSGAHSVKEIMDACRKPTEKLDVNLEEYQVVAAVRRGLGEFFFSLHLAREVAQRVEREKCAAKGKQVAK